MVGFGGGGGWWCGTIARATQPKLQPTTEATNEASRRTRDRASERMRERERETESKDVHGVGHRIRWVPRHGPVDWMDHD